MVRLNPVAAAPAYSANAFDLDAQVRQARAAINEAGRSLFESGALSAGRYFSAAVRLHDSNSIVIAGFSPRETGESNSVVVVDLRHQALNEPDPQGLREIAAVYAAVFNERPAINSVIHTQSPNLTAFAVAHRPLPVVYGTSLIKRSPDPIPVAPWTPRYAADPIIAALRAHPGAPAVLLANRGVLAWDEEPVAKLARFVGSLEEAASIVISAQVLGGAKPFPPGAFEAMQKSLAAD